MTRTTDLDDFDGEELFAIARHDLEKGRLEEALRKLKRVTLAENTIIEALPYAARAYGQLRLLEKAQECYRRYLKAKPDSIPQTFELGVTHFELGEKDEARKIWDGILGNAPTHPPTLFYSGLLAVQEGRMPDARRNLDVLLKSVPADNLYATRARELLNDIEKTAKPGH